jgi:hypothetical protein
MMKCAVCSTDLRVQESVLLPCSCFVCLCQYCARQQLRDGSLTYNSPVKCPSCEISVTSDSGIIEGVDDALKAEDKLVRRALARTKMEHSSAGVITNFVKLRTCYNKLLEEDNSDAELDNGEEPLGARKGENHARDVAVARYRMLISHIMLRHIPQSVDPITLVTFTNNPFIELHLERGGAQESSADRSAVADGSECVICRNEVKPGCSVLRMCSCKNVLCKNCAIQTLCLRQAETFHAGLKCPTCRKCSPNVVKNVPFLSECEDALVRSAEKYLAWLVYMRSKAKAETDEAFTLRSKAFYRDAVRLYWVLGFRSENKDEDHLERLTLNQLRFEVARLEEYRLNTCDIALTYDILGEPARTESGSIPLGFLSAAELQPSVFFERLVLRKETPIVSDAEAAAERNKNLLATIARWHYHTRKAPPLTAVDKIVLTAMYVQRDPADDALPYTFTLCEEVIEAVRSLLYKCSDLKRPFIDQALKRLSPPLLAEETLLKLYDQGLLAHVPSPVSGGSDAALTEWSGDKHGPIRVHSNHQCALSYFYSHSFAPSLIQARWRAGAILSVRGPSGAFGRLTTLLDPGLLKLAAQDCYVRTPPLDPVTASSRTLARLAYPTPAGRAMMTAQPRRHETGEVRYYCNYDSWDERYAKLRTTLCPQTAAQPLGSAPAVAAAPVVTGKQHNSGEEGSDRDDAAGDRAAAADYVAHRSVFAQRKGVKRGREEEWSSPFDRNKSIRAVYSGVFSGGPQSKGLTGGSSDGSSDDGDPAVASTATTAERAAAVPASASQSQASSSTVHLDRPVTSEGGTASANKGDTRLPKPSSAKPAAAAAAARSAGGLTAGSTGRGVAAVTQESAAAARASVTSSATTASAPQRPPRAPTAENGIQSRVLPTQPAAQPTAQRKAHAASASRPADKTAVRATQQRPYVQEVPDSSDSSSTSESDPELRQLLSHKPSKGRLSGLLATSDAAAPFATAATTGVVSRLYAGKSRNKAATVVNLTDIVDTDDDGELTPLPRQAPATSARSASTEVTPLTGAVPGGAVANAQQEVLRRLIHEQLPTLRKAIVDKEEAARVLRQENTQLTAQLLEAQEALQHARGDCNTHTNTIEGLRAQLRAREEANATTQSALDKCRSALEEANESSTSFADTASKRDAEVAQLRREAKASAEQMASLRKARDDMDTNNKKLQNTVNQLKHSSSKAQEDFKILRGRLDKADLDLSQKDNQVTTLSSTVTSLKTENDKLKAELAVRAALSNQTQHMAEENQRLQKDVLALQGECRNYNNRLHQVTEEHARGRKEWLTATEENQELRIAKQEQEEEIAHLKRKLKQRVAADARAADELLNELKNSGGTD